MYFDIFNRKTVSTDKMFFKTTLNPKQAIIIGNGVKFRRWIFFSTNLATFYAIILSIISILLIKSNMGVLDCLLLALANLIINRAIPRYWQIFFGPNAEYGRNHRPAILPILYIITLFSWLWSMARFVGSLIFITGVFVLVGLAGSLLSLWIWMNLNTVSCIPISESQWRTNAKRRGMSDEDIDKVIDSLKKRRAIYFSNHDK